MIRSIIESWNRGHAPRWWLDEAEARWNATQPWLSYTEIRSDVPKSSAIFARATESGRRLGLKPDTVWVHAWDLTPESAPAALEAWTAWAKSQGAKRLQWGADEFHVLSGLPHPGNAGDQALRELLQARGAKLHSVSDLVGDLATKAIDALAERALREAHARGARIEVTAPSPALALGDFLHQHFPGRWHREWKIPAEHPEAADGSRWLLLWQGANLLGFVRLAQRGGQRVLGALRMPLHDSGERLATDGCLGPIGVAPEARGGGWGGILLGLALAEARAAGTRRLAVDWTDAHRFYAPTGFVRWRELETCILPLVD